MKRRSSRGSRLAGLLLGLLLVAAGLGLLLAQLYGIDIRLDLIGLGWPIFVIVPGLLLLVGGLLADDEPGIGLSIAGGIVTMVGLILAYQYMTGHWASWAYAWALVAPGAVGAAMVLWGLLHLHGKTIRGGLSTLGVGLILFLVFFGFFEGVLGIGGERGLAGLGRTALPIALIVAGVLVIAARLWPRRRPYEWPEAWSSAESPATENTTPASGGAPADEPPADTAVLPTPAPSRAPPPATEHPQAAGSEQPPAGAEDDRRTE
jgi:hypothetical protein